MRTAASVLLLRPRKKLVNGIINVAAQEDYEVLMLERSDTRHVDLTALCAVNATWRSSLYIDKKCQTNKPIISLKQ